MVTTVSFVDCNTSDFCRAQNELCSSWFRSTVLLVRRRAHHWTTPALRRKSLQYLRRSTSSSATSFPQPQTASLAAVSRPGLQLALPLRPVLQAGPCRAALDVSSPEKCQSNSSRAAPRNKPRFPRARTAVFQRRAMVSNFLTIRPRNTSSNDSQAEYVYIRAVWLWTSPGLLPVGIWGASNSCESSFQEKPRRV